MIAIFSLFAGIAALLGAAIVFSIRSAVLFRKEAEQYGQQCLKEWDKYL